jgi:transketolase
MEECEMDKTEIIDKCKHLALELRRTIVKATYATGKKGVHIGSALSVVDILATLYGEIMRYGANPHDKSRDRFILSKGHAYIGLYSILNLMGFITDEELSEGFMTDGGFLPAHPVKNIEKGIECSTGSLGIGFSYAVGKAYYAKLMQLPYKTFVLLGDGECNEGVIWEAFMSASHFGLSNLIAIIDCNQLQHDGHTKDIMNINLEDVIRSFGWNVLSVDGHDIEQIYQALIQKNDNNKPMAIIANTIKGKGIPFMENDNNWHHAHLTEEKFNEAMNALI